MEFVMINVKKILEICEEKSLEHLPAVRQLINAKEADKTEDIERIGNNLAVFLKESGLWRNSSAPPDQSPRNTSIPPSGESKKQ